MSVIRSGNGKSGADAPATSAPARRRLLTRVTRKFSFAVLLILAVAAIAVSAGFLWFVARLPAQEVVLNRNADGIVVLTGGASRVNDAFELLTTGRGRRLLITGVYPATNPGEISRVLPEYQKMFACCVDLDRSAVNTLGNAIGTRRWAQQHGFRSLIVVTSAYHMPRALAELAHQLPEAVLIPFPVVTKKLWAESWWSSAATAKLLFSEYLKYLVAVIRIQIDPASAATTPSHFFALRRQ